VYIVVIFLYTVFPVVSTVIFQTFVYDTRLESEAYLKEDYSIKKEDAAQQAAVAYAPGMALLYCVGIPLFSWIGLYYKRYEIRKIQTIEESIMLLDKNPEAVAETYGGDVPTAAALVLKTPY
jgi:hypothetical protein